MFVVLSGPLCSLPEFPPHGQFEMSGRQLGDTLTYVCVHGYWIPGPHRVRVCQEDGTWSGAMPSCEGQINSENLQFREGGDGLQNRQVKYHRFTFGLFRY